MGGSIKVAVRSSDGTMNTEVRHTNALPYWIRHPRFIEADEAWFRRYVDMKSEYNEGDPTFAPVEYGVVVIDFLQRTVYEANSYSRLTDTVIGDAESMAFRIGLDESEEGQGVIFREMLDKGYLSVIQYPRKKGRDFPLLRIPLTEVTMETWDEKVFGAYREQEESGQFFFALGINFGDWTFKHFDHDVTGHEQLRAALMDAGFVLTTEDDAKFEAWRAERLLRTRNKRRSG